VIRGAVIHLLNEQPLLADLLAPPSPGDVTLVCTNLRMMNGKRPIFVDHIGSTFVFPYTQLRFLEVPQPVETAAAPSTASAVLAADQVESPELDEELELDEDLLRRVREL
jgi:hypothetical protein